MTGSQDTDFIYKGFSSPNGTIVPDDVFDVLLPQLSDPELRVLLYIIRKTFGWKKESDNISLSQMVSGVIAHDGRVLDGGCGLSRSSVIRGVRGLTKKGVIKAVRNTSKERGHESTTYQLHFEADPLSKSDTRGASVSNGQALVSGLDTQQTPLQTTEISHSNIRKSNSSNIDFVDNNTSQQISLESTRAASRNGSATYHGVEGIGSIMNRVVPQGEVVQPEKRQPGRPRKFQDEESQMLLNYVSDFAREFADKATLNQSATRIVNLYRKWGKGNFPIFIDILYQARATTKAQNNIRTSKFAYFCSVLEDLLDLKEEQTSVSGHHI